MRCDFRTCSGNSHLLRNECVAAGRLLARAPSSEKDGQMSKISWRQVSAFALAAFFVVGSLSNIFAPGSIYEEYLRWGYPHWFHFVTGSLELTTAVLLARGTDAAVGRGARLYRDVGGARDRHPPRRIRARGAAAYRGDTINSRRLDRLAEAAPQSCWFSSSPRANEFVTVRCKTLDFCTSATAARGPFRVISRPDAVKSRGPLSPESGPWLARL